MGVRQERREARTRELLDAAMELLVHEGLKGLTIGALAQQVDAAVGAIYRYFPSKTALLVALQLRAIEELRREVEAALARVDGASASAEVLRLAAALAVPHAYFEDLARTPARRLLIQRSLGAAGPLLDDADARRVDAALAPLLRLAAARIEAAAAAGDLDPGPADARALLAWAGVQGLSLFRNRDRLQPEALRSSALLPSLLEAQLRGWGADPTTAQAAVALLASLRSA